MSATGAPGPGPAVFRFADFELDLGRGVLRTTDGRELPLRRKSFDLMRLLVENAGKLLDRHVINNAVWPDVTVTDDSITQCIVDIRRAIGDKEQRILRTMPRRGYLFTADVARVTEASALPPPDATTERPALPLPDKPSLVVLPFANMSGEPEQEYFADGMVEEITTALSRIRSLFVIARQSAFTYKGRTIDIKQVGRELGVHYVLEGSVRKAGNRVRITGQLVEIVSGAHIWADRFDGTLKDVFVLQDRVTTSVVAAIAPAVRTAEMVRALRTPTTIPQAYDLSMRALSLHRSQTRSGLEEAASLLRQAITLDTNFALGNAQLSYVCWNIVAQGWVDRADPSVADMVSLAQRALAMDAEDPEILAIVGLVTALPGGDLKGGIALLDKSIALNENSALALRIAGSLHAYAGELTQAMTCLERAERLNPFDNGPLGYTARIIAHFVAGAYDAAVEWSDRALRDSPRHGASLRFRAASLGLLGQLEEARQTVQRLLELVPGLTIAHARHHFEYNMNNVFKTVGVAEAYYEGLRRAGIPES